MQQGDDDTSAGSADGVADGDRAAVDVDLAHVEAELTGNSDGLGREGFVGLDEVDIVDGQAGLLHGLTGSGHGADAHDLRVDAALAPADELGHGLEVVLLHGLAGSEDDGGSAVVDAGGVTGGDALDVLLGIGFVDAGGLEGVDDLVLNALGADGERAAQLGKTLGGGTGAGELILLELDDLLLDLHGDGNDLIVKTAGSLRGLGLLLGGSAEGVELFAGDAPNIADVLGGGAHVVVVERIPQAVLDHGVDKLLVAHAGAPAGVGSGIRSGAHVLGAAADDDIGVAGEDGAASLNDGLHTGAADHTDGIGGDGIGETGAHADLTGDVLTETGGQDAAEHQLIDILGSDIRALEGFLHDDGAELSGRGVLQGTAEGTDSGTAAVDDVQFFHLTSPLKFVNPE